MKSKVSTNGPAFLLRMSWARSFSFVTPAPLPVRSDSLQVNWEHLVRVGRLNHVVQVEAVNRAALDVGRRVRQRQCGDQALPLRNRLVQRHMPGAACDR